MCGRTSGGPQSPSWSDCSADGGSPQFSVGGGLLPHPWGQGGECHQHPARTQNKVQGHTVWTQSWRLPLPQDDRADRGAQALSVHREHSHSATWTGQTTTPAEQSLGETHFVTSLDLPLTSTRLLTWSLANSQREQYPGIQFFMRRAPTRTWPGSKSGAKGALTVMGAGTGELGEHPP